MAREIRLPGQDPISAPTPPLEALRTVLSAATTDWKGARPHDRRPASEGRTQISFIDVSRAYFNAKRDPDVDPVYVELPHEDPDNARDKVGRLLVHLCCTRAAADGWHCEYSSSLGEMGFEEGDASACIFRRSSGEIVCSVHGDDFILSGPKRDLDLVKSTMEQEYEHTESGRLGHGPTDDKEVEVLNRIVRWTTQGVEYEADPRHVEQIVRDLGLLGAKAVTTPGAKPTYEQACHSKPLPRAKLIPFRSVAARANYLAMDRPDIQLAAKEVCRWMSALTEASVMALKRLGRYLQGCPRLLFQYPYQTADKVDAHSDTDWAGCPKTRKSTNGGCLLVGSHLMKSWSSTQAVISLSSGEAEFYGVVKAS